MASRTPQPRRALHVLGRFDAGGVENWLLRLAATRDSAAWTFDFCLLGDDEGALAREARRMGFEVLRCPWRPAATFPWRLLRLIRRGGYEVIHSHLLLFGGLIAALAAWAGVRVRVVHAHNSRDGRRDTLGRRLYRGAMRRLIARFASCGLACSREAAAWAFGGLRPKTVRIVPYGLDLAEFAFPDEAARLELRLDARRAWGIGPREFVFFHVARMAEAKNQEFLLLAFAEALERKPRLRLALVGDGPLRASLERTAAELEMGDRVIFTGLRRDAPRLLTAIADGFVLPSLHEGLPVALLEAQAAGLPSLVSDRVSAEATPIGELAARLGIERPIDEWAEALVELSRQPRLGAAQAVARMRRAGFDAAGGWRRLTAIYDEESGRQSAALEAASRRESARGEAARA